MKVEVAFPGCVHVELVQANDLKHYEIFLWLVSLMASIASGFWVSYVCTAPVDNAIGWSAVAFTVLTLVFGSIAYYYRSRINDTKIKKTFLLESFNNK